MIELPAILNIPPKLLPIITDLGKYRYILLEGGRSSGKSQSIARLICWLCEQRLIRVVCGRETQNSIEESVYTIFRDIITQYNLGFDVMANKIIHKITGSEIVFKGFKETGSVNIKGLEGVDILWIDEAQSITSSSLAVIIPTIRKDTSKIIFSMNRHTTIDPVYKEFSNRPDCLTITINYNDNPFCPRSMQVEAEICKSRDAVDYEHIWLGKPLQQSDDTLIKAEAVYNSSKLNLWVGGGQRRVILGVDVARFGQDSTVFSIISTSGITNWSQVYLSSNQGKDTCWTTGEIIDLQRRWNVDLTIVDEGGIGGGVVDQLVEAKRPVMPFDGARKPQDERYVNKRAEGYFKLKGMLEGAKLQIDDHPRLQEELLGIRFRYMSNGQKGILSKDEMRKMGFKSPDYADSLMMAVSAIDDCLNQDNERLGLHRYAFTDDNIFMTGNRVLPRWG